jgi:hypothetical protein
MHKVQKGVLGMNQEYKLIVAGGRDFDDAARLALELEKLANGQLKDVAVSIVSGMARGADQLAYIYASANQVKIYSMPANWDKYGKGAGYKRNEAMGRMADGVLAFWDGKSRGTKHMIETMTLMGKDVFTITY